jgi:hypothetical protein
MKNRNNVFITIASALAFALAPIVQAGPSPDGGPTRPGPTPDGTPTYGSSTVRANANSESEAIEPEQLLVATIHSSGDVNRGKTGSFVVDMKQSTSSEKGYNPYHPYVNFSVSGTAIPGVDYVAIVPPAYIGQSGYGVILVQTLPNPRGSSSRQAYSVVVTLDGGLGYAVGQPSTATMWIKP